MRKHLETPTPAVEPSFHLVTRGADLLGFIAIDSTVAGRARGGLRLATNVSENEIRAAARSMTLKYGALGLPQGGAKAGIIGDGDATPAEKHRLLLAFAQAAAPLLHARRYVPDPDLGTAASDIRAMMESIGTTVRSRDWRANRSGEYTARSVLAAALALRGSLAGTRVAIEGFGKVGAALARLLAERGAVIVAVSTSHGALYHPAGLDVARLARRAMEVGSRFVEDEPDRLERAALLELPVDLLCPCARFESITTDNVGRVAATAICAGANDPVSPEAESLLAERGIPYPPDFLSNCGGVLGGTLEFAGVPPERIGAIIEAHVHARTLDLVSRATQLGVPARELAESEALARHATVRARAEHPDLAQRLVALGLEAYRRRLIPEKLMALIAPRYIARGLGK